MSKPTAGAMRAADEIMDAYDDRTLSWVLTARFATIIDAETGVLGLIEACEALLAHVEMRATPDTKTHYLHPLRVALAQVKGEPDGT